MKHIYELNISYGASQYDKEPQKPLTLGELNNRIIVTSTLMNAIHSSILAMSRTGLLIP